MPALTVRVSDDEASLLLAYSKAVGKSQSDLIRGYVASLESRLLHQKTAIANLNPYLLPSVPLARADLIEEASALYFLMDGEEVLYIGQTQNLSKRMIQGHHKRGAIEEAHPAARVHWMPVRRKARMILEKKAIERFSPPFQG